MSVLREFVSDYLAPALQDAMSEMLSAVIVCLLLLAVCVPLVWLAYRFLKRSGVAVNVNWGGPASGGRGRSGITIDQPPPQTYRLGNAELQMAQELVKQGQDLDAVCRRVSAEYAAWDPFRQQAFRSMMGEVLKSGSRV